MSTILERLQYGFDRDSRRTWQRRALAAGEDNHYGYDGLSQLANAARGNLNLNATAIGAVPVQEEAWDYDPTGNWRGYRVEGNGAVSLEQQRVHDRGNRLTQIENNPGAVALDRVGRMRQAPPDADGNWGQIIAIKWDAWSRPVQLEKGGIVIATYAYDGLMRRTTRILQGGRTVLHTYYSDAWRPLEIRRGNQTTANQQYYWGARHRDDLVRRDRATTSGGSLDETRYVLMDYFSPAAIIDASGSVTERYSFSAFGLRRILNPDFTPRTDSECAFEFAFQGQFLDSESGFLNYGYRYYSPALGRWLSKDPLGEVGGANIYYFVANAPPNAIDPLGLWQLTAFGGEGWGLYGSVGHNSGQWNFSARGGVGAGSSYTWDASDSGLRSSGWNQVTVAGSVGGFWGVGGEAGRGPEGAQAGASFRTAIAMIGITGTTQAPGAPAKGSVQGGYSSWGPGFFLGSGWTWTLDGGDSNTSPNGGAGGTTPTTPGRGWNSGRRFGGGGRGGGLNGEPYDKRRRSHGPPSEIFDTGCRRSTFDKPSGPKWHDKTWSDSENYNGYSDNPWDNDFFNQR